MNFAKPASLVAPLVCLALRTNDASAESLEGAFRVSLDATAIEYVHLSLEKQNETPIPAGTPVAPQADLTSSQTTVGLTGSGVGLGLAGAVSDNVVIGGRVAVGTTTTDVLSQSA